MEQLEQDKQEQLAKSRKEMLLEYKKNKEKLHKKEKGVFGRVLKTNQNVENIAKKTDKSTFSTTAASAAKTEKFILKQQAKVLQKIQPADMILSTETSITAASLETASLESNTASLESNTASLESNTASLENNIENNITSQDNDSDDGQQKIKNPEELLWSENATLKIEMEARDSQIVQLRNLNLKLLADLTQVKYEMSVFYEKEQSMEENQKVMEIKLLEKEALVNELNALIESLRAEVSLLQQKPNEYADIWTRAAELDEKQELDTEMKMKQITAELNQTRDALDSTTSLLQESTSRVKSLEQDLLKSNTELQEEKNRSEKLDHNLEESLECVEQLDKCLEASQDKAVSLENELRALEEQYTSLSIMSDTWKQDCDELQTALAETMQENKTLHEKVESQADMITTLETDMNTLYEATSLLEKEVQSHEASINDREETIEKLQCDVFGLESQVMQQSIIQDAQLVDGLTDALAENKKLHELVQSLESLGVGHETEMDGASESQGVQTELDLNYVIKEFMDTIKALKIAELSNNVMHQKNISQYEYFQEQMQSLGRENSELQKNIDDRQELVARLMKGLEVAAAKCANLESQLSSSQACQE